MSMSDWKVTGSRENLTGNWVYYAYTAANALFRAIHFSRHVDIGGEDHMATNDNHYYYYGWTKTYNDNNMPDQYKDALKKAWEDYFKVLPEK